MSDERRELGIGERAFQGVFGLFSLLIGNPFGGSGVSSAITGKESRLQEGVIDPYPDIWDEPPK